MNSSDTSTVPADPNQEYWNVGLASFNAGDPASVAIQKVWNAMMPPASLPLLATIIGALYGDTYWDLTKMSVSRLAADLQAALGINPSDCQKAAKSAFSTWCGLLVRANMSDAGKIPRDGSVTQSPDVVVNGAVPLTPDQLIRQWNVDIYTPTPGLKNYTYGRAASVGIHVPITTPVLRMFYSEAGFNPPPGTWVQQYTFDGQETTPLQGFTAGPLAPGARAASSDPFAFNPRGSGHYCLIAVVGTEYFTNDPSPAQGNWSSQEWLTNNGAAGWHNVDVARKSESTLKFYNQDGVPERFVFEAHCRNVPRGATVALESSEPGVAGALKSGDQRIRGAYQVVHAEALLPPHHAGTLTVRFALPGGKLLPRDASIDVQMHWVLPPGHPHYAQALEQLGDTASGPLGRAVRLPMGNFTFVGGA